ncbi:MAG: hypothetical protein JWO86_6015 [Myxococcaceae bacterium]|nr:hypothetical protein [Myxococcaceae bacterium]MEA2751394.1 hypothetical protein [Myxococcales bacterium]
MRIQLLFFGSGLAVTIASVVACATPNIPEDLPSDDQSSVTTPGTENKTPTGAYTRDGGSTPATGGGSGSGSGTTPAPAPTTTADASTPPPPVTTNACASSANGNACYSCCETQVPNGVPFLDNAWGECQCVAPALCAQACANEYCAGNGVIPGGSCDNCLAATDQTCGNQADNACAADANCSKLFACATNSGCAAKP